ncbi:MAG TPA: hypothetical protein DEA08_07650 [Planctomycetes bacterium]|nr:hypothetical protein [Planctomycetota bacterium]
MSSTHSTRLRGTAPSLALCAGAVLLAFQLGARTTAQDAAPRPQQQPGPTLAQRPSHELLNATLWVQASAEYRGLCHQAYGQATRQLEVALRNPGWTAELEQSKTPAPELAKLPPAVILDVDETVLDNSYYEARLILSGGTYGSKTWGAWCKEERATPVPGALDFCRAAHAAGVTVFYVTNRAAELAEATRNNLRKQGFPLREGVEVVRAKTDTSDKQPRRDAIAKEYRILLLIGDNGSDFAKPLLAESNAETQRYADERAGWWGERWILLPNPMYGHWEANAVQRKWGEENDLLRLQLRAGALSSQPKR